MNSEFENYMMGSFGGYPYSSGGNPTPAPGSRPLVGTPSQNPGGPRLGGRGIWQGGPTVNPFSGGPGVPGGGANAAPRANTGLGGIRPAPTSLMQGNAGERGFGLQKPMIQSGLQRQASLQ